MAYYPENRDFGDAISKLGAQLGVDMASNIIKEFAPDISRKFSRRHHPSNWSRVPRGGCQPDAT